MKRASFFVSFWVSSFILTASCATSTTRAPASESSTSSKAGDEVVMLVFGDQGTGKPEQYKVAKTMFSACQKEKCDFALVLGDNIYENGVTDVNDPKFKTAFELPFEAFGRFDFWMVAGNHDWRGNTLAQVEYSKQSERWRMPALHYRVPTSLNWLHIYGIDSDKLDNAQAGVVRQEMCGKSGWKLVFGHHSIYSNGPHGDSATMQKHLLPVIRDCGIQFYLSGHDHIQEHISGAVSGKLYDKNRFEQVIQGAAAKLYPIQKHWPDPKSPKQQLFIRSALGFAILRATPSRISMNYYDGLGGNVIYSFERELNQ